MSIEQTPSQTSRSASTSAGFVRKYLGGIFLVIGLILLSVFWGFNYKANMLIKDQLKRQGKAFFQEIVLTRDWMAEHGGVYVRLKPGMKVNPYLERVPGLKVIIKDEDGEIYTLKNPALATREISELAYEKGLFRFHITSLKPLNPANAADQFEQEALRRFEVGAKEHYTYVQDGEQVVFRYMAPLITKTSCLRCHASQGYREGDVRGGISVSVTATEMISQMDENSVYLTVSAVGVLLLILSIIWFISRVFIKDLKNAEQRLVEMATRDFLTGLLNRREMYRRLQEEYSRDARYGEALSLVMFDIDHFKQINDQYGHAIGDMVLQTISATALAALREYDIICRYGGEEFLIVTPKVIADDACKVAERLRVMISELKIPTDEAGGMIGVTISAGVAQLRTEERVEQLIYRADQALYQAKSGGRNRVVKADA